MMYLFVRVKGEKPYYGVVGFEDDEDSPTSIPLIAVPLEDVASCVCVAKRLLEYLAGKIDEPVIVDLTVEEVVSCLDLSEGEPPKRIYFDERLFVLKVKDMHIESLAEITNPTAEA